MKPELLLPAGDLEKLQTAVRFGADAVIISDPGLLALLFAWYMKEKWRRLPY